MGIVRGRGGVELYETGSCGDRIFEGGLATDHQLGGRWPTSRFTVCSAWASGSGRRGRLPLTARDLGVFAIVSSKFFSESNACVYEPSPYVVDGGEEEVPQHPHQVLPTWDPSNAGPVNSEFPSSTCLARGSAHSAVVKDDAC
jgi:hypothetical protein